MNLEVTVGAVGVLRVEVMLRASRLNCAHVMRHAVACQTKLGHAAGYQHPRIRRAVWRMTRATSLRLDWGMLEGEWPLLVGVALHASRISASGQSRLFESYKAAVP